MLKLEVIGNLGANAERKNNNGEIFVSFRVAHSRRIVNKSTGEVTEETTWVSCSMNGDAGRLFPYLVKGQKVFVRGNGQLKLFTSSKDGQKHAGLNLRVSEIELCGSPQTSAATEPTNEGTDEPF